MNLNQKDLENKNDSIDYRKIIKDSLRKKFSSYSFISDDDIEQELKIIDAKIALKNDIKKINQILNDELIKPKPDELKILKEIHEGSKKLAKAVDINDTAEFKDELVLFVALYDHYAAKPKTNSSNMDLIYRVNEIDSHIDATPLFNYFTADINLYNKLAKQIRKEEVNDNYDTLFTVLEDKNTQLYALVRTATIKYFKDYNKDLMEDMLEKVIKSYQGDCLMLEHVRKVVKNEYELKMGKYVPEVKESAVEDNLDIDANMSKKFLSEHEYYGFYAHIADEIKTLDKRYHEFLVLKYEYLYEFDEVKRIMSLDDETAKRYYIDSLNYISDLINNTKKDDVKSL